MLVQVSYPLLPVVQGHLNPRLMCYTHHLCTYISPIAILISVHPTSCWMWGYKIPRLGNPCQESISTRIGCGVQYSPVRVYCTSCQESISTHIGCRVRYSPVRVYCTSCQESISTHIGCRVQYSPVRVYCTSCQESISTHIGCGVRYSPIRVYCSLVPSLTPPRARTKTGGEKGGGGGGGGGGESGIFYHVGDVR